MPAAMQGELQPTINRFTFGGFEITNILDSKVIRDRLHPGIGSDQPADAAAELASANRIDANRLSRAEAQLIGPYTLDPERFARSYGRLEAVRRSGPISR